MTAEVSSDIYYWTNTLPIYRKTGESAMEPNKVLSGKRLLMVDDERTSLKR